jgi:hypothetical protein
MDPVAGRVVAVIRGEPWVANLPVILGGGGGVQFFCEWGSPTTLPKEPQVYRRGERPVGPAPRYNVLDAIPGLPDEAARGLTNRERDEVLAVFLLGRGAYEVLRRVPRTGLVTALASDLDAAVRHLSDTKTHTGQSKWSSLQVAEKCLKAFLQHRNVRYPRIHGLAQLATLTANAGLEPIPSD